MAQLPKIRHVRGVPELQSSKVAELRGKTAAIEAAVGVVDTASRLTNEALEQEAKLTSKTRMNQARRDYQTRMSELSQRAHNEVDYDPGMLLKDAQDIHDELGRETTKGQSGRVNKYLNPMLDDFRTQTQAYEQDIQKKLIPSRAILSLEEYSDSLAQQVQEEMNPQVAFDEFKEANDDAPIDLATKRSNEAQVRGRLVGEYLQTHRYEEDPEAFLDLMHSDMYKELTADQRSTVDQLFVESVSDSVDRFITIGREQMNKANGDPAVYERLSKQLYENFLDSGLDDLKMANWSDLFEPAGSILTEYQADMLIAQREYEKATDFINSQAGNRFIRDKPGYLTKVYSVKRLHTAQDVTDISDSAADNRARRVAGGVNDPSIAAERKKLLDGNLITDGERRALEKDQDLDDYLNETIDPQLEDLKNVPLSELGSRRDDLIYHDLDSVVTPHYQEKSQLHQRAAAAVKTEMATRTVDKYGDEFIQTPEGDELWATFLEDPTTKNWEAYDKKSKKAAKDAGVYNPDGLPIIPRSNGFAVSAALGLQGTRQERFNATASLYAQIGGDNAQALVEALGGSFSDQLGISAFRMNQPWMAERLLQGEAQVAALTNKSDVQDSLNGVAARGGYVIPWSVVAPEEAGKYQDAMLALAVSFTPEADVLNGNVTEEAVAAAHGFLFGPDGVFQMGGGPTVSYYDEDAREFAPAYEVREKFARLRRDPGYAEEIGLQLTDPAGMPLPYSTEEILSKAHMVPVGGSSYAIVVPGGVLTGLSGRINMKTDTGVVPAEVDFKDIGLDGQNWLFTGEMYDYLPEGTESAF